MFITIDGCDGAGKGRQIEFLKNWFNELGLDHVLYRDPGDTLLGESIRNLLLDRKDLSICSKSELALFMAARAQLVEEKIKPALAENKLVLLDRYLLSTVVYQGYAVGKSEKEIEQIWNIGVLLADRVLPDVTLILDCPADVASQRLCRTKDRIESKGAEYHYAVSEGYRLAAENWKRYSSGEVYLLDATQAPEKVFHRIQTILTPHFLNNRLTNKQ